MNSRYSLKVILVLAVIIFFAVIYGCSVDRSLRAKRFSSARPAVYNSPDSGQYFTGISSYYGKKFHGRKTANGETFNMYDLTAAHKTLPFGTVLEVQNLSNNKTVVVRINDRGPFVADRVLDLSYAAAEKIEMLQSGTANIRAKIIQKP